MSHISELQRMKQTDHYYIPCNRHAVLAEDECHMLCTVSHKHGPHGKALGDIMSPRTYEGADELNL